eukprot:s953_g8.t1
METMSQMASMATQFCTEAELTGLLSVSRCSSELLVQLLSGLPSLVEVSRLLNKQRDGGLPRSKGILHCRPLSVVQVAEHVKPYWCSVQ